LTALTFAVPKGTDRGIEDEAAPATTHTEGYAKLSLKKYRPIAARNEDRKVVNGLL
jgi:hypothetical protein